MFETEQAEITGDFLKEARATLMVQDTILGHTIEIPAQNYDGLRRGSNVINIGYLVNGKMHWHYYPEDQYEVWAEIKPRVDTESDNSTDFSPRTGLWQRFLYQVSRFSPLINSLG